jgi:cation transport ATPase
MRSHEHDGYGRDATAVLHVGKLHYASEAEQFESIAGHGAVATVDGRRVLVGKRRLLEREQISLNSLAARSAEMARCPARACSSPSTRSR